MPKMSNNFIVVGEDRRREATGRRDIRDTLGSAIWALSNVYNLKHLQGRINEQKEEASDSA